MQSITPHAGYLEAAVRGSAGGTYYVHVQLQENGDPRLAICTCPYFPRAGSCKHVAAVLLHRLAEEHPDAELSAPPVAGAALPRRSRSARGGAGAHDRPGPAGSTGSSRSTGRSSACAAARRSRGRARGCGRGSRNTGWCSPSRLRRDYEGPHWTLAPPGCTCGATAWPGKLYDWRPSLEVEPSTLEEKALFNRLLAREGARDALAPHLAFLAAHPCPTCSATRRARRCR